MGMIWNSQATLEMVEQVNFEFSGDPTLSTLHDGQNWYPPISYWQQQTVRDDFNGTTQKDLKDIAKQRHVQSSTENSNWMTWLGNLGDHSKGRSPHEKLRAAIFKGLNSNKYSEIVFGVIPLPDHTDVQITTTDFGATFVVLVQTPTYDQMNQVLAARIARRRRARKAAKKKKL
jgi:hypothetical protein